MTDITTAATQQKAARIAGFMFLFTVATAMWASMIRSDLIVYGDAAVTVGNILANERLFRFSIVLDMVTFTSVVILIFALYIILKPVNKNLARLGLIWRMLESACMFAMTLNLFIALRLLNEDVYSVFETSQLNALSMLFIDAYKLGYKFGLVFLFVGSAVFYYLLLVSKYVPRFLSIWALVGSIVLLAITFAAALFPEYGKILGKAYYIGLYEVALGFWLLFKGVNLQEKSQ